MLKGFQLRVVAFSGAAILFGGMFVVVSGASNHHSSQESNRKANKEIRSISITATGGTGMNSMNLSFKNLLPGAPQTVILNYRNTGNSSEDVWMVFPSPTALSALNTLGQYGSVQLSSAGTGALGNVFASQNLNDSSPTCGTFSVSGCWPLTSQYLLAKALTPGASGSFSFRFAFASAYDTQPSPGASDAWNPYPVPGQSTVNSNDGTGAGLPYQLVALEPGITPGEPDTIHQRAPFNDEVTTVESSTFVTQLMVEAPQSPATFLVTAPNAHLHVGEDGHISVVDGPLAPGSYAVSGTDTNTRAVSGYGASR